jgi:hypothetical protein
MVDVTTAIWRSVCIGLLSNNNIYHKCAVGNLTYSHATRVRLIVKLIKSFFHQIAACSKKGPNLKTKDLPTQIGLNLYHSLFLDLQLTTEVCTSNTESPCII